MRAAEELPQAGLMHSVVSTSLDDLGVFTQEEFHGLLVVLLFSNLADACKVKTAKKERPSSVRKTNFQIFVPD